MYALGALNLNKSELNGIEFTFNKALFKIFKVSQIENVRFCMEMYNIYNICDRYIMRKNRFLAKLKTLENLSLINLRL